MINAPKPYPCASCPYRSDVPSGVWAENEYVKLPEYDAEMAYQPPAVFMCHQADACLCSGWVGAHGPANLLALRLAMIGRHMDTEAAVKTADYVSPVPLFRSGQEAAEHGLRDLKTPGPDAQKVMDKLEARRDRRGPRNDG